MDKASLEVMAEIQGEDLGNIVDNLTTYSVWEMVEEYEAHLEDVHGDQRKRDRIAVEDYIGWMVAEDISNFNEETIDAHLRWLVGEGYAKSTIKTRYYGLVNFAESRLSETANSLARDVSYAEVVTDEMEKQGIDASGRMGKGARAITREEKKAMRETAPTHRTELMTELLWQCGLRAEEASTLEVDRIDLEDRSLSVDTVKRDDHEREIDFDMELKLMLDNYIDRYRPKYGRQSPYLFVSNKSDHPQPHNFIHTIKELADDAGVQDYTEMQNGARKAEITPHSFRKSLGIRMDEQGKSMKEIAETLGHSDIQTVTTYLDLR